MAEPSLGAWNDVLLMNPHAVADKRARVRNMFAAIAPSYDLNNHLHSLWMDQAWRRKAVKLAGLKPSDQVVDVACGTGDLTACFERRQRQLHTPDSAPALGIDFTYEMLPIARRKAAGRRALFIQGDALALPLPAACCDVVSIAFGIRNVSEPAAAIAEFHRVLRPGGRVVILEFSLPAHPVLRSLYNFYFRKVLPRTATLISGDRTGAYRYLPESVNTFIDRSAMKNLLEQAGFTNVSVVPMTFGICVCYVAEVS